MGFGVMKCCEQTALSSDVMKGVLVRGKRVVRVTFRSFVLAGLVFVMVDAMRQSFETVKNVKTSV